MDDLFWGLILLVVLAGSVAYILQRSEDNKKRQDEEYDKIQREYDKAVNKEEQINHK